jgi:hypothetical protein
MSGAGLPDLARHQAEWLTRIPMEFRMFIDFGGDGFPSGGGSDDASFICYGVPSFSIGGQSWNYGNYTWHTNRDTYDKVVFDDLKSNATLTAMLAYLAAEDTARITLERVDLAAAAAEAEARAAQNPNPTARRFPVPSKWPECEAAPRTTKPRLK